MNTLAMKWTLSLRINVNFAVTIVKANHLFTNVKDKNDTRMKTLRFMPRILTT